MGATLKNKIQWEEVINWQNFAYFLLQRKKLEECNRVLIQQNTNQKVNSPKKDHKSKDSSTPKNQQRNPMTPTSAGTPRMLEVDEDSIKITVVDDINVYLVHLELEQTVCFRILLFVANR